MLRRISGQRHQGWVALLLGAAGLTAGVIGTTVAPVTADSGGSSCPSSATTTAAQATTTTAAQATTTTAAQSTTTVPPSSTTTTVCASPLPAPLGAITTFAGGPGYGQATKVGQEPGSVFVRGTTVIVADEALDVVRSISLAAGMEVVVAGTGTTGYSGDGGLATSAQLALSIPATSPGGGGEGSSGAVMDASGDLYIADTANNVVRKVSASSRVISTVAGTGTAGYSGDGGPATQAALNSPSGLAVDGAGDVFIADTGNCLVRELVAATGEITTIAGLVTVSPGVPPTAGTCQGGGDGGPATQAALNSPSGVAVDAAGDLFIADTGNDAVREVAAKTGVISTVAGTASPGYSGDGGSATHAALNSPSGVAVDAPGDLFIADTGNDAVREVSIKTGDISTVAGVCGPSTLQGCAPSGGYSGDDGRQATEAELNLPSGVTVDAAGDLFIADTGNDRLRQVNTSGVISTIAGNGSTGFSGDGGMATAGELGAPQGMTVDPAGDVFIADPASDAVREVHARTGVISTVAGTGPPASGAAPGYSGDGGSATHAALNSPSGVAVDAPGDLFIADTGNDAVRMVAARTCASSCPFGMSSTTAGDVYTVAGTCGGTAGPATCTVSAGFAGDGGPATAAQLDGPTGLAVDAGGDLFIADTANSVVREVAAKTGAISTVAGTASPGYTGDGAAAAQGRLDLPQGVSLDAGGNLFIADTGNDAVREIPGLVAAPASATTTTTTAPGAGSGAQPLTTGDIYTVAGGCATPCAASPGYTGDGGPATSAQLNSPTGVAVDTAGDLFIADSGNDAIRQVNPAGTIVTAAGTCSGASGAGSSGGAAAPSAACTASPGYAGDGGPAAAALLDAPNGVAFDAAGNLYIADAANHVVREVLPRGVVRLAGADRVATAIAVSRNTFPVAGSATAAVLATAANFPDGLAGTPLAVAKGGPLLLSWPNGLDAGTEAELHRVLPAGKTVYVLGGTTALSPAIDRQLRADGYTVGRLAGATRFDTAAAIADAFGSPQTIILARGDTFADALPGGAAAAAASGVVLLTDGAQPAAATTSYLSAHSGATLYCLGGPACAAYPNVPKANQLVGQDRYATSVSAAQAFFPNPVTVGLASGQNFPDGLTGGVNAAHHGGPLLTTDPFTFPSSVETYVSGEAASLTAAYVYGGPAAVSAPVVSCFADTLAGQACGS